MKRSVLASRSVFRLPLFFAMSSPSRSRWRVEASSTLILLSPCPNLARPRSGTALGAGLMLLLTRRGEPSSRLIVIFRFDSCPPTRFLRVGALSKEMLIGHASPLVRPGHEFGRGAPRPAPFARGPRAGETGGGGRHPGPRQDRARRRNLGSARSTGVGREPFARESRTP